MNAIGIHTCHDRIGRQSAMENAQQWFCGVWRLDTIDRTLGDLFAKNCTHGQKEETWNL
jgi:hypothetical protein